MDYYLSLTSGNCESRNHVQALYACAYPLIDPSKDASVYEQHENRKEKMFFSQTKLREYFGVKTRIERLLSCECHYCSTSKNQDRSTLDIGNLPDIILSSVDGVLFLALLVYLSKLHFIYPWSTSQPKERTLRGAKFFLERNEEIQRHFDTEESKAMFKYACEHALEMFDPAILQFGGDPHPSNTCYDRIVRFPFCQVERISESTSGSLDRFQVLEEYCHGSIERHKRRYPGSTIGNGSDNKLLFVTKSMKKAEETLGEREILRIISAIEKPTAENIITLLTCYSWRNHIYLVFPYIESDLHVQLNEPHAIHDLPKVSTTEPLSKNWLWEQMVRVCDGVSTIHTGIKYPEGGDSSKVIVSHFDLKPGNILLTADNKLKITDFGQSYIELVTGNDKREAFYNEGDIVYRPPEIELTQHERAKQQLAAEGDERAYDITTAQLNYDVWSLACIMTEVLIYVFDNPDPNRPGKALEQFKADLESSPTALRFYDKSGAKDCVWATVESLPSLFQHEPAHHQYIMDVISMLGRMFHLNPYYRASSGNVCEGLEKARVTYENTIRTQGDPLANRVLVDPTPNEIGWVNDSDQVVSFAEMGNIQIEAVNRRTGIAIYSNKQCRIRLFRHEKNSFLLLWAREGTDHREGREITFPAWCFQPTYLFQSENKSDCMLFKSDERLEGEAYIFTFGSREDLYTFQGTLMQHRVMYKEEFSGLMRATFTFTKRRGSGSVVRDALVQFWATESPKLLKSSNTQGPRQRNPSAKQSVVETMAIFGAGTLIEIPLNNSQKIFRPQGHEIEVTSNSKLKHDYFKSYWSPLSLPWISQVQNGENPACLMTPSIRPGQAEKFDREKKKDKDQSTGYVKIQKMLIAVRRKDQKQQLKLAAADEWQRS